MCGIIACLGKNTAQILLDGLKQLQNRGYDSAGICSGNSEWLTHKYISDDKSAISKLEDIISQHQNHSIGIAHTRWATHGGKTQLNSHPHQSQNKLFCLVHNGIINNYYSLKNKLKDKNKTFVSETDSEVIVNLLEYNFENSLDHENLSITEKIANTIKKTISQLEGSWGIAILCSLLPDYIFVTRNGSPLLISTDNSKHIIITSEKSGFLNLVNNYIVLDNNDLGIISSVENSIYQVKTEKVYTNLKNEVEKIKLTPEPYNTWLEKEIREQATSSYRAINLGGRLLEDTVKLGGLERCQSKLVDIKNIILLGCGTSLYASQVGQYYFKKLANFNVVQVFDGAEFQEDDIPKLGKTAFILLSQSGETKDLYRVIEIGKKKNIILIGVINVVDSMIAREVDCGCYLNAGREVSVASTKSFTSQVIVLAMIAIWFSQIHQTQSNLRKRHIQDMRKLHLDIAKTIEVTFSKLDDLLKVFTPEMRGCFILGKGKGESIAKEGSLKIKEVSYIQAEGYSSSSLKHGPFALLDEKMPVIMLGSSQLDDSENFEKILNCYEEIKARKAPIIIISNGDKLDRIEEKLLVPSNSSFQDLLLVIPLQILALKLAERRGINPDKPRNLAKVVTVE